MASGSAGTRVKGAQGRGGADRRPAGRVGRIRSSGFVLLEVLVATAVMAGGILFALEALRSAARLTDTAEQRQHAIYLLEEQMAAVTEAETLEAGIRTGTFPSPRDDFSYRIVVSPIEKAPGGRPGVLWLIEAEVRYPSRPASRTVEASRHAWKPEPDS